MKNLKNKTMREFGNGAFRDNDGSKLQFSRALSPIVLIRFAEFMREHNNTADGQRDEGNWKKGFTRKSYIESKFRHFIETWLIQDGLKEHEEYPDLDPKQLEDVALEELIVSLCAEFFNTQGFLHVLLLEQRERRKKTKKYNIKATRKISVKTKSAAKRNSQKAIHFIQRLVPKII